VGINTATLLGLIGINTATLLGLIGISTATLLGLIGINTATLLGLIGISTAIPSFFDCRASSLDVFSAFGTTIVRLSFGL
jgi:hypothetical protein